jgi:hypothetical protein
MLASGMWKPKAKTAETEEDAAADKDQPKNSKT